MFTKDARVSQGITRSHVKQGSPPRKGTVIALTDDPHKVVVEWDKSSWGGSKTEVAKVDVSGLMLETDATAEFDRLSAEFDKMQESIHAVVQESADKLTEAMKMAQANGEELAELYEAVQPLLRAMNNAGWRTSSLHC